MFSGEPARNRWQNSWLVTFKGQGKTGRKHNATENVFGRALDQSVCLAWEAPIWLPTQAFQRMISNTGKQHSIDSQLPTQETTTSNLPTQAFKSRLQPSNKGWQQRLTTTTENNGRQF